MWIGNDLIKSNEFYVFPNCTKRIIILMSSIPGRETINTENRGLLINSLCEWEYLQTHNKSGPITVNST